MRVHAPDVNAALTPVGTGAYPRVPLAHRWTAPLAIVVALAGCAGGASTASPRATLEALQRAAQRDDVAALYALLPASARRAESLAQFRTRIAAERHERAELAA